VYSPALLKGSSKMSVSLVLQIIREPLPLLNLFAHSNRPVKLAIFPFLLILSHARNKMGLVVGRKLFKTMSHTSKNAFLFPSGPVRIQSPMNLLVCPVMFSSFPKHRLDFVLFPAFDLWTVYIDIYLPYL
jgi:hypothetical protein